MIDYYSIAERDHPDLLGRIVIEDSAEYYARCRDREGYAEKGWACEAVIAEIKRREALAIAERRVR